MLGWVLVAAVTAAYDAWAVIWEHQTMSTVARRHPFVVGAAIAAFVAHLWGADTRGYFRT